MSWSNAGKRRVHYKFPTKALLSLIDSIQAKNTDVPELEVMKDVTQAVEEVRQERFVKSMR